MLDSIRGLAAFQVVLLHEFSAFFPQLVFSEPSASFAGLAHFSPMFLFYDGYSAVYIFFALSGYVLTPLFARYADRPLRAVASRVSRLAVPAFAAFVLSIAVFETLGRLHLVAGSRLNSVWLFYVWRPLGGLGYLAYDFLIQGLTLGYANTSVVAGLPLERFLQPVEQAYVAPFWTLSAEMQGSLLILALAILARINRKVALIGAALSAALLIRTYFAPFILGFVLAEFNGLAFLRRLGAAPLALFALIGFSLCVLEEWRTISDAVKCPVHLQIWFPCTSHALKTYGSCLVFLAALGSARLERALNWPLFLWMGKLSFPIYLVHWPMVCGVGSLVYVVVSDRLGNGATACGAAVVVSLLLSVFAAHHFAIIDDWAVAASRSLRGKRGALVHAPAAKTGLA